MAQWKEGVSLLGGMRKPANEHKILMVQMSQNIAIAANKLGDHAEAIAACSNALKIDDKAEKALYQRSVAYLKLKDWDLAQQDCKTAVTLNPKEKAYRDHWELIKQEKTKQSKD